MVDDRKAQVQFEGFTQQLNVDVDTAIKNAENTANYSLEQSTRAQKAPLILNRIKKQWTWLEGMASS